jgi:3-hydroxyisobutyrate dehydrogenase-like beta-hydroxyacid dehydrogenase
MVNNMAQVEEVAFQLMEHLPPESRTTLIIMSTVSPDDVRQLRTRLDEMGRDKIGLMDAPVSGSPVLAETGGLAIYVGGEKSVFEKARPVLEAMGDKDKMFYMGDLGMGASMKLVNNIVGIIVGMNVNEAMYLGKKKGLDPDLMARAINAGSGKNFITENWPLARMAFAEMLNDTTYNSKGALFVTGIKDLTVTKNWAEKDNIRMVGVENAIKQIEALDEEKLVTIISTVIGKEQAA